MRKKIIGTDKGAVTLEACVIVTLFMFFMLFFLGLFSMFMVQNSIAHSVIQTTQSLALEKHITEELAFESGDGLKEIITQVTLTLFDEKNDNVYFSNTSKWYESEECADVIKERFIGYLSGGDKEKADNYLNNMRIVNGLDGIDFTESKVEKNILYIVAKYKIKYLFTLGSIGEIEAKQRFSAKLW